MQVKVRVRASLAAFSMQRLTSLTAPASAYALAPLSWQVLHLRKVWQAVRQRRSPLQACERMSRLVKKLVKRPTPFKSSLVRSGQVKHQKSQACEEAARLAKAPT